MSADRFSVTMDSELAAAVRGAAKAEDVTASAWIAEVVAAHVRHKLLGEALDAWQAEFGPITDEDIAGADAFMEDVEREIQEKKAARRRGSAA